MDFVKYYQDELSYLREMGVEFSKYYPKLAPYLAKHGSDPDVERLLEAFAFLSARVRQKIDDEIPEITESLFEILWPHLLRPIPSYTIIKYHPIPGAVTERKTIGKNIEMESVSVDGTRCRFRSVYNVDIDPIEISSISTFVNGNRSSVAIEISRSTGAVNELHNLDALRFYINGDIYEAEKLYYHLSHDVDMISVVHQGGDYVRELKPDKIHFVGLDDDESMLPYPDNIDDRFRLLQEYYCFRNKFYFFEIRGIGDCFPVSSNADSFQIVIRFKKNVVVEDVATGRFLLHCTPAINLFTKEAEPIRLKENKAEYRIHLGNDQYDQFDIFTVDQVNGRRQGESRNRLYSQYLYHESRYFDSQVQDYYTLKREPAIVGGGSDVYIRFPSIEASGETISIDLTCTNKNLPARLKKGDIKYATANTPEFVTFENITVPTVSYPPPIRQNTHWLLVKNMSFGKLSAVSRESLLEIFSLYNYPAFYSHQEQRANELRKDSIVALQVTNGNFLVGSKVRKGQQISINVDDNKYSHRGEMDLFLNVLFHIFTGMAPLNHVTKMDVVEQVKGGRFEWPR